MFRNGLRWIIISVVLIIILFVAIMFFGLLAGKPREVSEVNQQACLHSDYETIMMKVIRENTEETGKWKDFSDAQAAAERSHMLIEPSRIYLVNDIWMVPFTQYKDEKGTKHFMGLLDCKTDSVEISGG